MRLRLGRGEVVRIAKGGVSRQIRGRHYGVGAFPLLGGDPDGDGFDRGGHAQILADGKAERGRVTDILDCLFTGGPFTAAPRDEWNLRYPHSIFILVQSNVEIHAPILRQRRHSFG